MSFAAGQALAYLKVAVLAVAVMAAVGVVVRIIETTGRGEDDGGNNEDAG